MINHNTEHKFGSGVTYAAPIDLSAKKPMDARFYADTLVERDAHFTNKRCYPGMTVYVAETGLTYIYDGEDVDDEGITTPIWIIMADRAWVTRQITEAGGLTEEQVRNIIAEVLLEQENLGKINDIRTYTYGPRDVYTKMFSDMALLPEVGVIGILYKHSILDKVYRWNGSEYVEIEPNDYLSYFPLKGVEDVQYVDDHQNTEYQWVKDSETTGHYELINDTATESDIRNIFD